MLFETSNLALFVFVTCFLFHSSWCGQVLFVSISGSGDDCTLERPCGFKNVIESEGSIIRETEVILKLMPGQYDFSLIGCIEISSFFSNRSITIDSAYRNEEVVLTRSTPSDTFFSVVAENLILRFSSVCFRDVPPSARYPIIRETITYKLLNLSLYFEHVRMEDVFVKFVDQCTGMGVITVHTIDIKDSFFQNCSHLFDLPFHYASYGYHDFYLNIVNSVFDQLNTRLFYYSELESHLASTLIHNAWINIFNSTFRNSDLSSLLVFRLLKGECTKSAYICDDQKIVMNINSSSFENLFLSEHKLMEHPVLISVDPFNRASSSVSIDNLRISDLIAVSAYQNSGLFEMMNFGYCSLDGVNISRVSNNGIGFVGFLFQRSTGNSDQTDINLTTVGIVNSKFSFTNGFGALLYFRDDLRKSEIPEDQMPMKLFNVHVENCVFTMNGPIFYFDSDMDYPESTITVFNVRNSIFSSNELCIQMMTKEGSTEILDSVFTYNRGVMKSWSNRSTEMIVPSTTVYKRYSLTVDNNLFDSNSDKGILITFPDGNSFDGYYEKYILIFRNNRATDNLQSVINFVNRNFVVFADTLIQNNSFIGNSANFGSALFFLCSISRQGFPDIENVFMQIRNNEFVGNVVEDEGGALHIGFIECEMRLEMNGNTYKSNEARVGGALELEIITTRHVNVKIFDECFLGNRAYDEGGAIYVLYAFIGWVGLDKTATFDVNSNIFSENTVDSTGGVLLFQGRGFVDVGNLDFTFSNNTVTRSINTEVLYLRFQQQVGHARIHGNVFERNSGDRGIIFILDFQNVITVGKFLTITVSQNRFSKNGADHGGAINLYRSETLSEIIIQNNTFNESVSRNDYGGAIFADLEDGLGGLKILDNQFLNCRSRSRGGGAIFIAFQYCVEYGEMLITGNNFFSNEAEYGGSIHVQVVCVSSVIGQMNFKGNHYENNLANSYGGAIMIEGKCENNKCDPMNCDGVNLWKFENESFVQNHARVDGGGIYMLLNCLVASHRSESLDFSPLERNNLFVRNSCDDREGCDYVSSPQSISSREMVIFSYCDITKKPNNWTLDCIVKGVQVLDFWGNEIREIPWKNDFKCFKEVTCKSINGNKLTLLPKAVDENLISIVIRESDVRVVTKRYDEQFCANVSIIYQSNWDNSSILEIPLDVISTSGFDIRKLIPVFIVVGVCMLIMAIIIPVLCCFVFIVTRSFLKKKKTIDLLEEELRSPFLNSIDSSIMSEITMSLDLGVRSVEFVKYYSSLHDLTLDYSDPRVIEERICFFLLGLDNPEKSPKGISNPGRFALLKKSKLHLNRIKNVFDTRSSLLGDNMFYFGDWKCGKPSGKGKIFYLRSKRDKGTLRFEGNFEEGKRVGFGKVFKKGVLSQYVIYKMGTSIFGVDVSFSVDKNDDLFETDDVDIQGMTELSKIGGFGELYLCEDKVTVFKKMNSEEERDTLREALLISGLDHPNVMEITKVRWKKQPFGFFCRKYEVNLRQLITQQRGRIGEKEKLKYCYEICCGMKYLWEVRIMHLDLKMENVMIDYFGNVRIIDFGLSRRTQDSYYLEKRGTFAYYSPEFLNMLLHGRVQSHVHTRIDVWSFGILVYELFIEEYFSKDIVEAQMLEGIDNSQKISIILNLLTGLKLDYGKLKNYSYGEKIVDIIKKCLCENDNSRPSFSELMEEFHITCIRVLTNTQ